MTFEDPIAAQADDAQFPRLANLDVVTQILESGTDAEMEELRAFHDLSPERLALMRFFAQQRLAVLKQMGEQLAIREVQNPAASVDEYNMGAFAESIEPQVRDAVLTMRRKGFQTMSSGYGDYDIQSINFDAVPNMAAYKPSSELQALLEKQNIDFHSDESTVWFSCRTPLSVGDLKIVWDAIADDLPDQGQGAGKSKMSAAEFFQALQDEFAKRREAGVTLHDIKDEISMRYRGKHLNED